MSDSPNPRDVELQELIDLLKRATHPPSEEQIQQAREMTDTTPIPTINDIRKTIQELQQAGLNIRTKPIEPTQ